MIDLTVKNIVATDSSDYGAIICHTPKCVIKDNKTSLCSLIKTTDDLVNVFGDPFVDPYIYSDLVVAYDLINRNIPLYISSVYDMHNSGDDDFSNISYNGCTEFYFKDSEGYDTVGYKLKSDVKLCQPIIRDISITNNGHRLSLSIDLFYIDRTRVRSVDTINKLSDSRLYRTIVFIFDLDTVTDADIVSDFSKNGFELVVKNSGDDSKALVKELVNFANNKLMILLNSSVPDDYTPLEDASVYVVTKYYWYDIHTSDYRFDFSEDSAIYSYKSAIDELVEMKPSPIMLCLGRLCVSENKFDDDNNCISSSLVAIDPITHIGVCNLLLEAFDEDSDTYLFINTPDLALSSTIKLLSAEDKYANSMTLYSNYNADLFFGYAVDFVDNSLANTNSRNTLYSAALLTFYKLMLARDTYITNNYVDLNISNNKVKLILSESSAEKLVSCRCNSIVTFDIGRPSTYGDRSLSSSANLKYSHISRNFVRLRRLIKDFLETRKFIINTLFNIQSAVDYIRINILDDFISRGILSNYTINYTIDRQSVYIKINLLFPSVAEIIALDFTI